MQLSAILLSGGIGSRMASEVPKQYLELGGKAIALHCFELLQNHPAVDEVIVVCDTPFAPLFAPAPIAKPGKRRQDSLWNGLQLASGRTILVHDAARPFIDPEDLDQVIEVGIKSGAATLASPLKTTIKEADKLLTVTKTLDRSSLYAIQTPQVVSKEILQNGFAIAQREQRTVTDDVSLAELANEPVQLVLCSETNLKITTPFDLTVAKALYEKSETHHRL